LANTKPAVNVQERSKTAQGRQINALLNDVETPADVRAELEAERDRLAPVVPFPKPGPLWNLVPYLHQDSKKPTRADLDAWQKRIEDGRAGISRQRTAKELDKQRPRFSPCSTVES